MVRTESRIDRLLRSAWVRALVALAVAAVGGWVWWLAFRFFEHDLDMAFLAWPVGIIMALGLYLFIGFLYRRAGPRAAPLHLSPSLLRRQVDRTLSQLPELTHTVHPVGDPWPKAVIGPTGVCLVEPIRLPGHLGAREDEVLLDGKPAPVEVFGETRRLLPTVRELLHGYHELDVPVQGLLVVDEATIVPPTLTLEHRDLRFVHVVELSSAVDVGQPMPAGTVERAAAAIRSWRPHGAATRVSSL